MDSAPRESADRQDLSSEEFPAAAERLLEMTIERPNGRQRVIKEIKLPSLEDRERHKQMEALAAGIVEAQSNPLMTRLAASQLQTITDFFGLPFIHDIFDKHLTGNAKDEASMGRREWRDTILRPQDPEAFEYFESNALRASAAVNAALNAIAALKEIAPPPTDEGRALLARWVRGAEEIQEMLRRGPKEEAGEGEDERLAQIREIMRNTNTYDSLSSQKKELFVRDIRRFLYGALKEIAPVYRKDAARNA